MNESLRQETKERAVLMALQYDMALIRRGLEVWVVRKDGSSELISRSAEYDTLWSDADNALKKKFQ